MQHCAVKASNCGQAVSISWPGGGWLRHALKLEAEHATFLNVAFFAMLQISDCFYCFRAAIWVSVAPAQHCAVQASNSGHAVSIYGLGVGGCAMCLS